MVTSNVISPDVPPPTLRQKIVAQGVCIGPTFGNDFDLCPCDEPDCTVCVEQKRLFKEWVSRG